MTKTNFDAYKGPKRLLLVDGAGHGYSYLINKKEYQKKIEEFILKTLDENA